MTVSKVINLFPEDPIEIGCIGRVHGILGWVRVFSFTDKRDSIFEYCYWFIYIRSVWKKIYFDRWKVNKKNFIVKIIGIRSRETAKMLTNCKILIDKKQLPTLKTDEFYWKDIIGCVVNTLKRYCLGYVVYIIDTLAHDILVVRAFTYNDINNKSKDILIPFLYKKTIKNVDLINRVIIVDWELNF